jgi:hypothetical protein
MRVKVLTGTLMVQCNKLDFILWQPSVDVSSRPFNSATCASEPNPIKRLNLTRFEGKSRDHIHKLIYKEYP